MTEIIITEKVCTYCLKSQPLTAFYRRSVTSDKVTSRCKICYDKCRKSRPKPLPIQNLPDEEWRVCMENDSYAVSNMGRIKRIKFHRYTRQGETLVKPTPQGVGYWAVTLGEGKKTRIHRIVCRAFHGEPLPEQTDVNHIDNDRTNNRADNLQWCTRKENLHWGKQQGRDNRGERNGQAKLTEESAKQIIHLLKTTTRKHGDIGNQFGVSDNTVQLINVGKRWKYLLVNEVFPLRPK